jgi:hypothetical protein
VTWNVAVGNRGRAAAVGVAVANRLPAGFRFLSAAGAHCSVRGPGVITCPLGTMARGAIRTYRITARTPGGPRRGLLAAVVLGKALERTFTNNLTVSPVRVLAAGTTCPPGGCQAPFTG